MEMALYLRHEMRKRHLLVFGVSVISLLLVFALISPYALNHDYFKTLIETKISDSTGVQVRISGNIGLAFLPEQLILLEKVSIINRDSTLATFDMVAIHLNILPILKGTEGIDSIELFKPAIYIERNEDGVLNIESLRRKVSGQASYKVNKITLVNGSFVYSDLQNAHALKLEGVNMLINDLDLDLALPSYKVDKITLVNGSLAYSDLQNAHALKLGGLNMLINDLVLDPALPEKASFNGTLKVKKIDADLLAVSDISMGITAGEGIYNIDSLKVDILGGRGEGTVSINVNGDYPMVAVRSDLSSLSLETISNTFKRKELLKGDFDLSLDIMMQANRIGESIRTVNGSFDLSGRSLMVEGMDIDDLLQKYRTTQNIGVMEIGAYLIAGPLGMAFNTGVELGGLYGAGMGKDGDIREFISSWEIKDGVVTARGAAFTTEKNRLALTGKLDLVNGKFEDFVVSVLDTEGCSEFTQKINGPLKDLQFKNLLIKKSLFGSTISLIKKAGKFLSGSKCTPFYVGAVQHPQSTAN